MAPVFLLLVAFAAEHAEKAALFLLLWRLLRRLLAIVGQDDDAAGCKAAFCSALARRSLTWNVAVVGVGAAIVVLVIAILLVVAIILAAAERPKFFLRLVELGRRRIVALGDASGDER